MDNSERLNPPSSMERASHPDDVRRLAERHANSIDFAPHYGDWGMGAGKWRLSIQGDVPYGYTLYLMHQHANNEPFGYDPVVLDITEPIFVERGELELIRAYIDRILEGDNGQTEESDEVEADEA